MISWFNALKISFLTVLTLFTVLTCFVSDMTHTAQAYGVNVNILELPCAYACAYLTSENQALGNNNKILLLKEFLHYL